MVKKKENKVGKETNNCENRKIFNYFKEHTAFLIAIVSLVIAFVTATLKLSEYLKLKINLSTWGYDIRYVDVTSLNNLYVSFSILLLTITILIIEFIITNTINKCSALYDRSIYLTFTLIEINKYINKYKKNEATIKDKNVLIDKCKQEKKEIYKVKRNIYSILLATNIPYILLSILVYAIVIFIVYSINEFNNVIGYFALLLIMIIYIIYPYLSNYFSRFFRIYIKEYMKNKDLKYFINKAYEVKTSDLEKIIEPIHTHILDDKTIKSILVCSLTSILLTIFIFGSALINKNDVKQMHITEIENQKYAIAYQSTNNIYYLNKVLIVNNTATVFKNKQMIIKTDMIKYNIEKFDSTYFVER